MTDGILVKGIRIHHPKKLSSSSAIIVDTMHRPSTSITRVSRASLASHHRSLQIKVSALFVVFSSLQRFFKTIFFRSEFSILPGTMSGEITLFMPVFDPSKNHHSTLISV